MKKTAIIFVMIFALCSQVFAQFEIEAKLPIGFSALAAKASGNITIPIDTGSELMTDMTAKLDDDNTFGLMTGAIIEVGYNFALANETGLIGISLLADLGYNAQIIQTDFTPTTFPWSAITYSQSTLFHLLNVGILHKFNIYKESIIEPFSVGLGYGVKIPVAASTIHEFAGIEKIEDFSGSDLQNQLKSPVIGYVKFIFDAYYHTSKNSAVVYGLYLGYSFGLGYSEAGLASLGIKELDYNSFDFGLTIGFAFGKANPKIN